MERRRAELVAYAVAGLPRAVVIAALACVSVCSHLFGAPPSPVDTLEAQVREWLAVRRELVRVRTEWDEQARVLEDEVRLLERQKATLTQELAGHRRAAQLSADALAAARAKKTVAATALASLGDAVVSAETQLRGWRPLLPDLLRVRLENAFDRLAATQTKPASDTIAARLQLVLGLYGQIEQLNRSLHTGRMVLTTPQGGDVEMDVLFVGLAAGYAVSPDASRAAVGRPSAAGWSWAWDAALAPAIADALACYRKDRPAALIDLPLRVGEGGK